MIINIVVADDEIGFTGWVDDTAMGKIEASKVHSLVKTIIRSVAKQGVSIYTCQDLSSLVDLLNQDISVQILLTDKVRMWLNGMDKKNAIQFIETYKQRIKSERIGIIILSGDVESTEETTALRNYIDDLYLGWIYKGEDSDETIERVSELLTRINKEPSVRPKLQPSQRKQVEFLTGLKHSIAHCFLSIDIDLQGVREALQTQSEEKAIVYLWNTLGAKSDEEYYSKKLDYARFLIVGEDRFKDGAELDKPTLPEGKSIQDLAEMSDNPQAEAWLRVVRMLLGIDGDYKIEEFFSKLDEKIPEFKALGDDESEVEAKLKATEKQEYSKYLHEVLKFPPIDRDSLFEHCGVQPTDEDKKRFPNQINSFHDWCRTLDDAMDRLRGLL